MAQPAPHSPDTPSHGALRGSSHRFPYVAWLMTLLWIAIVAGLVYADLRPARGLPRWAAWAALGVFALPGVFFLWYSVAASLRHARYRALRLELSPLPALTGRLIAGALDVPVPYDPLHRYAVRIESVEFRRDILRPRNTLVHVLHHEELEARASPGTLGTRLRFALRIPAQAEPSTHAGGATRWIPAARGRVWRTWTLVISAAVPGVDLQETFEIPVARATSAQATPDLEAHSAALSPALSAERAMPPTLSCVTTQENGNWVIRQPAWQKPGTPLSHAFVLMAYFSVVALVGTVITWAGVWLIGGVFILAGLVYGVGVFVAVASELRAEIGRDRIRIRRSLLGLRLKEVQLDRARIAAVEVVTQSVPGGGAPSRSVEVREPGGVRHCVVEFIQSAREADALRDQVIARLGFKPGPASEATAQADDPMAARRSKRRSILLRAGVVGLMILQGVTMQHPEWFSFFATAPEQPAPAIPAPAPASPHERAMSQAGRLESRGDLKGAIAQLDAATRAAHETYGEDHPLEAWTLYRRAQTQRRARDIPAAKQSLDEALRIMARHTPAAARTLLGNRAGEFDIERLARYGGEFLWDERRYAEAHDYYIKARQAGLEVEVDDAERNYRRAASSAGVMATACMLGRWELADEAMAELKQRHARADPSARKGLQYWIDTGEPRLKARKC